MTEDTPARSYRSRTRSTNGVIGSWSRETTACMRASRTMKFAADVSSSSRNARQPASTASTAAAAWEVLPLASSVEKEVVSTRFGSSPMNGEMSTLRTERPSSARSFTAVASVATYSRPSPAIWSYTPVSMALSSVDLPWYPPPAITVTPRGSPMPATRPRWGRSSSTLSDAGDANGSAPRMGRLDTPLSRGRTDPSATKHTRPRRPSSSRMACWSSASSTAARTSRSGRFANRSASRTQRGT